MNRGSQVTSTVVFGGEVASMRPRFMNRGSFAVSGPAPLGYRASMRPRFMNRGSGSGRILDSPANALQ